MNDDTVNPDPDPVQEQSMPQPLEPSNNVDEAGVAHFLLIVSGEPDQCGGCNKEWPCAGRVALQVIGDPVANPERDELEVIAFNAARQALISTRGEHHVDA
jgi:hypothetical protein